MNDLEKHLEELTEATRRAGSVVNERVDEIVAAAERRATEIMRSAEKDAEETRRRAERDAEETRRRAEREGEMARREAASSADRVFERISSLERPLADLVGSLRFEADKVGRELEGHVDTSATAIAAESQGGPARTPQEAEVVRTEPVDEPAVEVVGPEREPEAVEQPVEAVEEVRSEEEIEDAVEEPAAGHPPPPPLAPEPGLEPDADRHGPQPYAPAASEPAEANSTGERPPPAPWSREPATTPAAPLPFKTAEAQEEDKPGLFSRLRPGGSKRPFITSPGHCAVCQKSFQAGSEEALAASGWRVNGDVGLCPEDQADGWQLPEGARLPFRRGGS